jgi:hypothetical protein
MLAHSPRIVTDGLVLCLDAANPKSYPGSGTNWSDLSVAKNNGILLNGVEYSSNNGGNLVFDGVNDTVDCGTAPQIGSSLTGLTVSVWINTSSASTRCILENGTSYTTNTFYLFQENSQYFTFEVYGEAYDVVYANYVYQTGVWYNLVGVWNSGFPVSIYTNGILTNGTRGGSTRTTLINGNTHLFIGTRAGTSYPFSGNIGYVQIYNKALTDQEIQQNFNATRGRYGI